MKAIIRNRVLIHTFILIFGVIFSFFPLLNEDIQIEIYFGVFGGWLYQGDLVIPFINIGLFFSLGFWLRYISIYFSKDEMSIQWLLKSDQLKKEILFIAIGTLSYVLMYRLFIQ